MKAPAAGHVCWAGVKCRRRLPGAEGHGLGAAGGVGAARTPPAWLRNGDVVEVEIPGVGRLSNPVRDE